MIGYEPGHQPATVKAELTDVPRLVGLPRPGEAGGDHRMLQWIYVVAEHRRGGVASALLRMLAGWFVEQGARRVCVDVGDDEARPFYRRHGAVELNRHWMVWNDIGEVVARAAST